MTPISQTKSGLKVARRLYDEVAGWTVCLVERLQKQRTETAGGKFLSGAPLVAEGLEQLFAHYDQLDEDLRAEPL